MPKPERFQIRDHCRPWRCPAYLYQLPLIVLANRFQVTLAFASFAAIRSTAVANYAIFSAVIEPRKPTIFWHSFGTLGASNWHLSTPLPAAKYLSYQV